MTAATPIQIDPDDVERPGIREEGSTRLERLLASAKLGLEVNARAFLRFAGFPGRTLEAQTLGELDRFASNRCAYPASVEDAVRLFEEADRRKPVGVYVMANEPDAIVATRGSRNAWRVMGKNESTTDADMIRRLLLFLDFDFERATNTSATDEEVRRVFEVADRARARLLRVLPEGAIGDGHSGNGASLMVALAWLPETPELAALVKGILEAAHRLFSDPAHVRDRKVRGVVGVDTTVCDAKRLCPAFGTTKRKGSPDVPERPHRRTAFLAPADVVRVGVAELEALLADLESDLDADGLAAVAKAMGRKPAPGASNGASPPRARPSSARSESDPFETAKALDMRGVLEWLGLVAGDRPVCSGCGLSDQGVEIVGTGLKCSHDRCSDRGFAKGYRTTVDVVVEARGVTPIEAVRLLGEQFGFEVPAPAPRSRADAPPPVANDDSTCAPTKKRKHQPRPGDFERGDHVELAARMLAELGPREDLVGDEGRLHLYGASCGLFEEVDRGDQSRVVQGFAGTAAGEKGKPLEVSAGDVSGAMRLAYDQVHVRDFFAGAPPGISFRNGFASVTERSVSLQPHARENRARAGYPFAFEPSARPARWLRFLSEVFASDPDQAQRIAFLREWLGAALLGLVPRWELAIVLLGGGANGKSTFIRIVSGVMPKGSTCAIPPQLWGNEYRLAAMRGCRLNIVAELPTGDILASESFKAIVSGDEIDARAIREAPFKLRAIAGHLFAANALPGTRDLSDAFWRRLVVLRFSQTFDRSRADTTLADRILAEETPAIVAWMLAGAADLLARGRFEVPSSSQAEVEAWKRKADAVALFVSECTVDADPRDRVTCADFYARFRRWADGQGFQIPTSRTVGERMAAMGKGSAKSHGIRMYPVRWCLDTDETDEADDHDAEGPRW